MASLAEKVKQLRAERGLTLNQLSDRTGISISHLNAIERGNRPNPSFHFMSRLATVLAVPLDYFRDEPGEETGDLDAHMQAAADDRALFRALAQLYDDETRRFIASEHSRPYVSLAKQLAEQSRQHPELDVPSVLQVIAQFMRDRDAPYNDA